jgi:two-component system nitrogen regulation sensor histidine kinase NtrY
MSNKSVASFSFFFFFVLFFLGLSLSINNTNSQTEEKVQSDFQYKILDFSEELTTILQKLNETIDEQGLIAFEEQALIDQNNRSEHLAFYLYKNHELIFWTNNHILIPESDSLFTQMLSCSKIGPHWLLMQTISNQNYTLLGVKILQVDYTLQNEFLHDNVLEDYGIQEHLELSKKRSDYKIFDIEGNFLFSFIFKGDPHSSSHMPFLLFFAFLLSYVFFAFCVDTVLSKSKIVTGSATTKIFAFSALSGIYLLFFVWIGFPSTLFQSPLFQPQLYANLSIYSSLGQLFLISIWLFSSILYFNQNINLKAFKNRSLLIQISLSTGILLGISALYYGLYALLVSLVFDSQINLEITAITQMGFYSYTVLILMMFLQLSWFLLSKKLIEFVLVILKNKLFFILLAFFIAFIFGYLPLQSSLISQYNQLFLFAYFMSVFYLFSRNFQAAFWQNAYFLFLFISISSIYYTNLSNQKEEEVRKAGLSTYLLKNDPLLENHFLIEKERILSDSVLISYLNESSFSYEEVISLINQSYFKEASKNYEISMVFCDLESKLLLLPEEIETPCYPFFEDRVRQAIDTIEENVLFLVDQHFRTKNYIGIVEFPIDKENKIKLFVEFLSKYQPKELGMPALLSDGKTWDLRFFKNYAYAYYFDGNLSEWFGKYDYKQNLESYGENLFENENYFSFEGYSHFVYVQDNQDVLLVSKPDISWLEQIASLAFLFLFYSLNISGLFLLIYLSRNFSYLNIGFRTRLQISMVAVLLFSFFTIGLASLYYLYYLNNEKNKSVLMEKAHSVLIELEHKLQDIDESSEDQREYLESLLIKFSQVFFTDINLYDLEGKLLATSRPQLFDSELLSQRMDPNAIYNLGIMKSSLFIHNEQIGLQEFYSAYLPFRSVEKQTVAYLNLPYFAKQDELEEEISGFLVAYLNIYMFLILLTLALTILISNYLSKPLKLLREKIHRVRLEAPNEKIEWNKKDEIGALIFEYNRMVEELAESAEKLARSQRESAWREMAQQIAHEIKNPLTPMKLNIQYLEKAWTEGGEDFDKKLPKITQNLTEQIDNLSEIASQFSSFAAMEQIKAEAVPVNSLIISTINLFSGHKHIHFETHLPEEELYIMADRNQFIRILNNLLKNAIQSISEKEKGEIKIDLFTHYENVVIQIEDNGCGISEEEKLHVFEPRFTTKTGGMGLGLALVKKMTENAKGNIRFESEENHGTRFILQFPKHIII